MGCAEGWRLRPGRASLASDGQYQQRDGQQQPAARNFGLLFLHPATLTANAAGQQELRHEWGVSAQKGAKSRQERSI
ncbi:MAG: hypothetical protein JSV45_16495 [Chromatiales bacterium]|nr:MAG: hypothetical protein JSV45_16495 [Chromatiales bacterium]